MTYLRNCWYQIAWSDDVQSGRCFARTILDTPMAVWRDSQGQIATLLDRCPHRFAPLSAGVASGDTVTCGYHGLSFDRNGSCVANPHGPTVSAMQVQSFPSVEQFGAIWVWMGEPDAADPALLPNLSFIDQTPPIARVQATLPTAADYRLIADNILDLSHLDFVHPNTLGGMMANAASKLSVDGNRVIMEYVAKDAVTPPGFKMIVPEGASDIRQNLTWSPPGSMVLSTTIVPAGATPKPADERLTFHNVTPETESSTHYFVCSTRRFAVDDGEVTERIRETLMRAFVEEDKPMIERQQKNMGANDLWELGPVLMSIDSGAVRARRILDDLIVSECQ